MRGYDEKLKTEEKNIKNIMGKVVARYIADNPIEPVKYRLSNLSGFKRNDKFRYNLDFKSKFPEIKDGSRVYAWGKIVVQQIRNFSFFIRPYGPTKVFINGNEVYRSSLLAENDEKVSEQFEYTAECDVLSIIIVATSCKTGCGAEFGTAMIKSNPFYVLGPTRERGSEEGFVYTEPQDEAIDIDFEVDDHEKIGEFYPKYDYTQNEKKLPIMERLNVKKKEKLYAVFKINIVVSDEYVFSSSIDDIEFWLKDKKINNNEKMTLSIGEKVVIAFFKDKTNDSNVEIKVEGHNNSPTLYSAFSKSFPTLSYIKIESGIHATYEVLSDFSRPIGGNYWFVDLPNRQIRIFLETKLFGKWTYPLGVTLRGLLDFAIKFNNKSVLDYVQEHINFCTSHYKYALWDREKFGAPAINNNIAVIDSLDDCGSFARTVLEVNKYCTLEDSDIILSDIAEYIMDKQWRSSIGAFCRSHAHIPLMEDTMWLDDLYMSVPFLVAYSKRMTNKVYFDEAKQQLTLYYEKLWMPDKQLFGHVYNMKRNTGTDIPWGRGNGWYLFSLTEILLSLSSKDRGYKRFFEIYQEIITGLNKNIGINNMWHQILDDQDSYEETSCSLIIIYSFLLGYKNHWLEDKKLERKFLMNVLKSWNYISRNEVDVYGNLYGVCRGSGYSFNRDYYKYDLLPLVNDTHGIGIFLMAGCKVYEILELI